MREICVSKVKSFICLLLALLGISVCSAGNTLDQQLSNARQAQNELSADVHN